MQTSRATRVNNILQFQLRKFQRQTPTVRVFNFGFIVIVGEKCATIVERMHKYDRIMQPGLNFKIPMIERLAYALDVREKVIEISS